jgi:hypothetical protein
MIKGYDQWKTASPHDDGLDDPDWLTNLVKDDVIVGFGRRCHGMNGKDADLDYGGQLQVRSIYSHDPIGAKNLNIIMDLHSYASICEPILDFNTEQETYYFMKAQPKLTEAQMEELQEQATQMAEFYVMDFNGYDGEWTGSDYWQFRLETKARIEFSADDWDLCEDGNQEAIHALSVKLSSECYENKEVQSFEESMKQLAKDVDSIPNQIQKQQKNERRLR